MARWISCTLVMLGAQLHAQDTQSFTAEGEARYFGFWEGTWYKLAGDKADGNAGSFRVQKSVHPAPSNG